MMTLCAPSNWVITDCAYRLGTDTDTCNTKCVQATLNHCHKHGANVAITATPYQAGELLLWNQMPRINLPTRNGKPKLRKLPGCLWYNPGNTAFAMSLFVVYAPRGPLDQYPAGVNFLQGRHAHLLNERQVPRFGGKRL